MNSEIRSGRRYHDRAFKARLVELSLQPGASTSGIAREHGINTNLLFTWRSEHRRAAATSRAPQPGTLLPVRLSTPIEEVPATGAVQMLPAQTSEPAASKSASPGVIELEIAGAQLRLRGDVDEDSLCTVLRALRNSA